MIEIRITDPHLMPSRDVYNLGVYLMAVAGHDIVSAPALVTHPVVEQPVVEQPAVDPVIEHMEQAPRVEVYQNPADAFPSLDANPEPTSIDAKLAAAQAADVDVDGRLWDAKLHSRTRSKNAQGRWTPKRMSPPAKVAANEMAISQSPQPTAAEVFGSVPAAPAEPKDVYADFIVWITDLVASGKLAAADVKGTCLALKLMSMGELQDRPDLIPKFEKIVKATMEAKACLTQD